MKTISNRPMPPGLAAFGLTAVAAGVALLISACASAPPPTDQVAVSTAAVSRASSEGAGEAAPAEIRTARDKLDRAKLAMASKDYDQARSLAQEAQVDAQLAESKAHSAKARKASDEVQESIRVLREEMDRKAN